MSTRRGRPYLLGESSQSHTTPMDSQSIVTLADVMAKLDNLIQPLESHKQRMKRGSPCMASTTREVVEEFDS